MAEVKEKRIRDIINYLIVNDYLEQTNAEFPIIRMTTKAKSVLFHDEKIIMASSVPLNGQYGEDGIFVGCPALIGSKGIEEVIEFNLPPEELAAFKACCEKIRLNIAKAAKIPEA